MNRKGEGKMKKISLIIAGIGPHAKRIYVPALLKLRSKFDVVISLVIDLVEKEQEIRDYFESINMLPDFLFITPFKGELPIDMRDRLNQEVKDKGIDGIIISTEPTVHKPYAQWALSQGLHILMDKPITTRDNVVSDMKEAQGIYQDYMELLSAYRELQVKRKTIFSINVQRRFHPGFIEAQKLIGEMASTVNCPVTSIQSMHCDGQWRLPSEIVTQKYHPYNSGYGKVSHSGYHIFDIVYRFYKAAAITMKEADSAEVFTSFVQPSGFIYQLTEKDYECYFGDKYDEVKLYSDRELLRIYENYGEMDAFSNIRLLRENVNICNISINLLHNSFARRTWVKPGSDLYKGNGRVKHEYHNIQQGPFQNIQIHSYQAEDKHDHNIPSDYEIGGNNHFDIYVFRNVGMTGGTKPMEIIRMGELVNMGAYNSKRLTSEETKEHVVEEFLSFMQGSITRQDLLSNIDDHEIPVKIMSSIYLSHIQQTVGLNPLVKLDLAIRRANHWPYVRPNIRGCESGNKRNPLIPTVRI
jgi:predicted dehydrogenase